MRSKEGDSEERALIHGDAKEVTVDSATRLLTRSHASFH